MRLWLYAGLVALALAPLEASAAKKSATKKGKAKKHEAPSAAPNTGGASGSGHECTDISGKVVPAKTAADCKAPNQWMETPPGLGGKKK